MKWNINPVYKRVDTCGAEFDVKTSYMYSTYEGDLTRNIFHCECNPSNRKKIIIVGSGCNRIGQGIEFDYACVHASYAARELGYETVMINCNPETVSTDYDTSNRLYFSPLCTEEVLDILDLELKKGDLVGVIVQLGGQTPLKLAKSIEKFGVRILGTSVDSIDLAEDRERFSNFINHRHCVLIPL